MLKLLCFFVGLHSTLGTFDTSRVPMRQYSPLARYTVVLLFQSSCGSDLVPFATPRRLALYRWKYCVCRWRSCYPRWTCRWGKGGDINSRKLFCRCSSEVLLSCLLLGHAKGLSRLTFSEQQVSTQYGFRVTYFETKYAPCLLLD